jgi:hypothetical protein
VQQHFIEVGLVADRVGAAEHRVFRLLHERTKRGTVHQRPHAIEKVCRILAERQQRDTARIVDVFVERARDAGRRRRLDKRPRRLAATERQKLHEQAAIAALRLAVLHAAFFADVGRLGSSTRAWG